jgi:hypothetical protein
LKPKNRILNGFRKRSFEGGGSRMAKEFKLARRKAIKLCGYYVNNSIHDARVYGLDYVHNWSNI